MTSEIGVGINLANIIAYGGIIIIIIACAVMYFRRKRKSLKMK